MKVECRTHWRHSWTANARPWIAQSGNSELSTVLFQLLSGIRDLSTLAIPSPRSYFRSTHDISSPLADLVRPAGALAGPKPMRLSKVEHDGM